MCLPSSTPPFSKLGTYKTVKQTTETCTPDEPKSKVFRTFSNEPALKFDCGFQNALVPQTLGGGKKKKKKND